MNTDSDGHSTGQDPDEFGLESLPPEWLAGVAERAAQPATVDDADELRARLRRTDDENESQDER